jgi:aldehyde:ferredoxin oxidoreductase
LYGYAGKILRVNLSNGRHSTDTLSDEDAKRFIGGKGTAIRILFNELRPKIDPLGPENKLVYAIGPFAATGIPLNSRWVVAGKSPETGIWADSYCGGTFAVQLRKAGYDALVVEGASKDPVYINILNDDVEVRDASHASHASHLWGKTTLETELDIARDLGITDRREDNPAVVNIGLAGENLVKFAAVMHTAHRAAGRAGLGAVMGAKKLKAIAVRGTKSVSTANPTKVREIMKAISTETVTNPNIVNFTKHGQVGFVGALNQLGMLPTKNFQQGTYHRYESISGETMTQTILKSRNTCSQCAVNCKREVEVLDGSYAPVNPEYGGPEYENDAALGSLLLIDDLKAISKENQLCNAYGLDTISTGVVIAWVMECIDRGIFSKADIDGIDVTWGKVDAALKLIEKIATRDGVGNILADGVKLAAKKLGRGSERYAVEVKGLEIPMHEPRAKKGLGLSYATSPRGGCHMQAFHDPEFEAPNLAPEIGITLGLDRHDTSRNKVDIIRRSQDWVAITNSLLFCTSPGWSGYNYTKPAFLTDAYNAITGWDLTVDDLMRAGERINNLCRCFNAREGITRKDDYLPPRFTEDVLPDGPSKGQRITNEELQFMLDNYYDLRGWDKTTGIPTTAKLRELGLELAE